MPIERRPKRRHGGMEERNSDGPMDPDVDESEEIDMALGCQKGITTTSKPAARSLLPETKTSLRNYIGSPTGHLVLAIR